MSYVLGIDIGGTNTTAAVSRLAGNSWTRPEIVPLAARSPSIPSTLRLAPNGSLTVDEQPGSSRRADDGPVARGFLRRVGDDVPMMVGDETWSPQALTAVLATWVVDQVVAREGGRHAEQIVLSHPAGWGPYRRELLHRALWDAGLANVTLLPEPVNAAESHASRGFAGRMLAVHSLGGESFAASVVRRTPVGVFELLGTMEGVEPLGGADFDEALARHVRDRLDHQFRPAEPSGTVPLPALVGPCAEAKRQLTVAAETDVRLHLPEGATRVPITRTEFEEMIRPLVLLTVRTLARVIRSGGLRPEHLDGVLLIGGSARIPLVAELVAVEFSGPVTVEPDPAATTAAGAAWAACRIVAPPRRRPSGPDLNRPRTAANQVRNDRSAPDPEPVDDDRREPPPRPPVQLTPLKLPRNRRTAAPAAAARSAGRGTDPSTGRGTDPSTGRGTDPSIGRGPDPSIGRGPDPSAGRAEHSRARS